MPRQKLIAKCSKCGVERPIFDLKRKICGSCVGKGGRGRPRIYEKVLIKKPVPAPKEPREEAPPVVADARPESDQFLCDACSAPVRYAQRKCKCGTWIDWRGSPVEGDPDIVICPECGSVCGYAEQIMPFTKCPHCNFGG